MFVYYTSQAIHTKAASLTYFTFSTILPVILVHRTEHSIGFLPCLSLFYNRQNGNLLLHADGQGGVTHAWKQHPKHVLILSNAGKPIWTLHGDENALAGLTAVIQALVSFVHDKGDSMKSIRYQGLHSYLLPER